MSAQHERQRERHEDGKDREPTKPSTPAPGKKDAPPARDPSPPHSRRNEPLRAPTRDPRDLPEPPIIQEPPAPDANPIDPRVFATLTIRDAAARVLV